MFTLDEALDKWIEKLPWGLKIVYQQDRYRNTAPFYCSNCGWYYPHDNWLSPYCPKCKSKAIQVHNNMQLGLFG